MLASLRHYWRMNLAVVAAAAVATAVLTGALLVGDSVRHSLRRLALDRLGAVDLALVAEHPFDEGLASRLAGTPAFSEGFEAVSPALLLQGAARHGESSRRASRVSVYGVSGDFGSFFPEAAGALPPRPGEGSLFPGLVVNEALRRELDARVGDAILLSLEGLSLVPRESLLGERDPEAAMETLRLTLVEVLPDRGAGGFGLAPHQSVPRNAFVALEELQRRVGLEDQVNALLVAGSGEPPPPEAEERLAGLLRQSLELEDLGLELEGEAAPDSDAGPLVVLESRQFLLPPAAVETARRLAEEAGAATQEVFTYLANSLRHRDRTVPYSTVAALEMPSSEAFGSLRPAGEEARVSLAPGELLLNRWTAEELAAAPGDEVTLDYYLVDARDRLVTEEATLRVTGVVAMEGLGADPTLAPNFPGMSQSPDMAGWDPPFPVDLGRIRPPDEAYWDQHRAAPKAFLALEEGQRLWRSRFGRLTAMRLAPPPGSGAAELRESLRRGLLRELPLEAFGMVFRPVKARSMEASSGATDFGGLFIGFSLFLIISAALLVVLLFSLGVERRAPEIGLRLAVGLTVASVRRRMLAEAAVLAALGGALGILLAMLYASALVGGLHALWAPLLETPFLRLHLDLRSLALGYGISLLLVVGAIALSIRRLRRLPAPALLAGEVRPEAGEPGSGRLALATAVASGLGAGVLLVAALSDAWTSPALFFGVGGALSVLGFSLFALWCRRPGSRLTSGAGALATMAARNSARNAGRSLLSVALVGSACFILVSVGANRRDVSAEDLGRKSGAGGFDLVAEAEIPLRLDLEETRDLRRAGLEGKALAAVEALEIVPFRLRPGEDASCLNLFQPTRPRILGVPDELVDRGGFHFRDAVEERENPWTLLQQDLGPGVIPAIGDYNSVRWILHLALGEELTLEDGRGDELRLRVVALLERSVFQSELLIGEGAFRRHFPREGGHAYFLAAAPGGPGQEAIGPLEEAFAEHGLDVTTTRQKLASFQAVEDVYLTTFQLLGGLGLLLGTVGLGVVLLRNVLERRRELATLRAFGYRRSTLGWMVVVENAFLLVVGLVVGSVSGLLAVAPHLLAGGEAVPWGSLAATVALVFVVGLGASVLAVRGSLRSPLLPVLKEE